MTFSLKKNYTQAIDDWRIFVFDSKQNLTLVQSYKYIHKKGHVIDLIDSNALLLVHTNKCRVFERNLAKQSKAVFVSTRMGGVLSKFKGTVRVFSSFLEKRLANSCVPLRYSYCLPTYLPSRSVLASDICTLRVILNKNQ